MVFIDLDMPDKNGLECIIEIRKNPAYKTLPLVVFSSANRTHNIETAYEMGADLFFIKPSIYTELISSLIAIRQQDWRNPQKIKERYHINGRYTPFIYSNNDNLLH
jgi:CheY-like chemotaxis protein